MPGNIQPITFEQQQARYRYPLTPAELPQGETPLRYSNFILTKTGETIVQTTQYNQMQVVVPEQLPLTQPLYELALRQPSPFPFPVTPSTQGPVSLTPQVPAQPVPVAEPVTPVLQPLLPTVLPNASPEPLALAVPLADGLTSELAEIPRADSQFTAAALNPSGNRDISTLAVSLPGEEPVLASLLQQSDPPKPVPIPLLPSFDSQQWFRQLDGRLIGQHPMTSPVPWDRPPQPTQRGGTPREQSGGALGQQLFSPFRMPMAMASSQGGNPQGKPDQYNPALYKRLAPGLGGWQA